MIASVLAMQAQEIKGLVIDGSQGMGLPGATVQLNNGMEGTAADAGGRFSFTGLQEGIYTLTVSYLGYETREQKVAVAAGKVSRITFSLLPAVISGEEIVVTGTRTERKLEDVPVRMELISAKTFTEIPSNNITGYLQQTTGVNVHNAGGFISHKGNVTMRGMSGSNQSRVLVLLDGIPINKADGGSVNWHLVQPEQLKRVEITKGPGSSLYGGNALGGVINMISAKPLNPVQGFAKVEYGSLNTFGGKLNVAGNLAGEEEKGFYYSLNTYFRQSDGYINHALEDEETREYLVEPDTASTTRKNDMKEYGVNVKAGYQFNANHSLELNAAYYDDFRGTGFQYYHPEGSSAEHDTWSASMIYTGTAGNISLKGNLYARNENYVKLNDSDRDSKYYSVESDRKDMGLMFHASMPLGEANTLTAGVDAKIGSVDAVDVYQLVSDQVFNRGKMNTMAFFIQDELNVLNDRLHIVAGLRFDRAKYYDGAYYIEDATSATDILNDLVDPDQAEHNWNAISPRISAQYRISDDIRVFGTYSRGFRPSILDDLCRSGFVRGGFKRANPNLEPENLNSYEVGADVHVAGLTVSPSFYYSKGEDFMYYVSTGDSIPMFGRVRPIRQVENIGEVEIKGFELDLRYSLSLSLELFAGYNWNESLVTEFDPEFSAQSEDITGKYLAYVPKNRLNAGASFRNPLLNASLVVSYTDAQFADDMNEVEIDPYTSLDLRLWRNFGRIGVKLDVENLLDTVQLVDDGYLNYGRFIRFEVNYSF